MDALVLTSLISLVNADNPRFSLTEFPDHVKYTAAGWDLLREGKAFEAGKLMFLERKAKHVNHFEPVHAALNLRIGSVLFEMYSQSETVSGAGKELAKDSALDILNGVSLIENEIVNRYGSLEDPKVENTLVQLEFLLQFSLFHVWKFRGSTDELNYGIAEAIWDAHRLNEIYNYQGVDPFLLALCPPYLMWDRYTVDDAVYELLPDRRLAVTPVKEFDLEKFPLGGLRIENFGRADDKAR